MISEQEEPNEEKKRSDPEGIPRNDSKGHNCDNRLLQEMMNLSKCAKVENICRGNSQVLNF